MHESVCVRADRCVWWECVWGGMVYRQAQAHMVRCMCKGGGQGQCAGEHMGWCHRGRACAWGGVRGGCCMLGETQR